MRRAFMLLLLVLIVGASLAFLMQLDSGYVVIEFHGTSVETSVWFAALGFIFLFVLFYYASRLLLSVLDMAARLRGRARSSAAARPMRFGSAGFSTRGALALQHGRWKQAVRLLARGAKRAEAPFLNHMLAARASLAMGDAELAEGFLQLAAETPGAHDAIALARAEARASLGDHQGALELLDAARLDYGESPAAMRLLLETLERLGQWERVASLVPQARRAATIPASLLDAIESRAGLRMLELAANASSSVHAAWQSLSQPVRQQPQLLAAYARALARSGCADEAEKLLLHTLRNEWHGELVRELGMLATGDPSRQLRNAETLLKKHPQDPALLLALGRVALRNRLWGKARDFFESAMSLDESGECCAEAARLYAHLGDQDRSSALLRRALRIEVGDLPALPLPERHGD